MVAADVYAVTPHIGRGGWTWYTGSAGLMYRLIMESLLGLRLEVDKLYIEPCLPMEWDSYKVFYRYRETIYQITIIQLHGKDDKNNNNIITLVDDHQEHSIEVGIVRPGTSK